MVRDPITQVWLNGATHETRGRQPVQQGSIVIGSRRLSSVVWLRVFLVRGHDVRYGIVGLQNLRFELGCWV